ncbi:carboxypeptidase regulatory-like domain-containing protein [Aliikangiella coralliicola]|nr:carboxypeptidase regulatory-like domain-containing protein [Aliikangiella coralliicola]
MKKITNPLAAILLSGIIACGGGGGGGGTTTPPANQAPNAAAPADFNAVEATTVTLDGSGSSDSDGSIATYAWTQTAGTPSVTLNNASMASASFTAPDVAANTQLTFQLTVTDDDGATNSDTVVVTITPDMPPQAVAPADFQAVEATTVSLNGTGSSDDVLITNYLWEQISGDSVTLTNANMATASFTAPDVPDNQTTELGFRLTVTDSASVTAADEVTVTIINQPATVALSGKVTYDHVPHNTSTDGLDYNNTFQAPVRGATVELLNESKASILQTTTSDANGDYSFDVDPSTSYVVRVKAELKKTGAVPTWDTTIVDNTNSQALYAMDSAIQAVNTSPVTLNINAASGWTGSSYGNTRVAAPFAILDSVYEAHEKIVAVDSTVALAALKINWSINNVAVNGDTSQGQISTSHFNGTEVFILGDANSDTDEYDGHVVVHEWGHYFEGRLSRSDSLGGSHSGSDKLDMRVAVGEGFGNALSGIITDDSFYRDSFGSGQSQGFNINVESNPTSNQGWFSEFTVQSLLYDIYDSNNDGADNLSLGFGPIYQALINGEKTTDALTSIFSLANQIKVESPANASAIDALLASQSVIAADDFGSTETNNGGDARNLPVYKAITIGGGSIEVCSFGDNGSYNKLGNRQFIRVDISTAGSYQFTANGKSAGDNPNFHVYRQGQFVFGGEASGDESVTRSLDPGTYIMDVHERSNITGGAGKDTCIDVSISAN